MPPRRHVRQQRRKRRIKRFLIVVGLILILAAIAGGIAWLVSLVAGSAGGGSTQTTTTAGPKEPAVVSTATLGSSGDILIHTPVMRSAKVAADNYNFEPMFHYLKPYVSKLDYAAINLEFGIGKGESDYWQREMLFRVPASLIDTVMDTGYTLGLCANNHVSNGSSLSFTEQTYAQRNLDHIGLRASKQDKRYLVKDVNGIKLGFVNYTYGSETSDQSLVNYFSTENLDAFYSDMQTQMANMKAEGAQAIIAYLHWGNEYEIKPRSSQTQMAQKLCEMGVDVIVGGHPHKIQPLELITADNGNQTVCLYSMGNILSNQTIEAMYGGDSSTTSGGDWQLGGACKIRDVKSRYNDENYGKHEANCNDNGHTEDGLLFQCNFTRYEDGTVLLSGVDVLPTWCYCKKRTDGSSLNNYTIVPLDKATANWSTAFGVAEEDVIFAQRSYDRTMALVGDGITAINNACKAKTDAYVEAFKAAQTTSTTAAQ
ncbi:MAG: CapA family protein [Clostridia bacterium]|nr:CapA family protein [Clostridia bacterium]